MTANGWVQILFFFAAILLVTAPLGAFMYRVLEGRDHFLKRPLGWLERLVYRLGGVDGREQPWTVYTGALLAFSAFTLVVTYLIQRLQHVLPFNPQGFGPVEAGSAFNTAASFTTNTNWQGYVGEATMSYLSQMAGLAWHNFISAAAGIAVAVALARGLTRRGDGKGPGTIGNFWVDLTRATVYILLPICVVVTLVFVSQGMIQSLAPYQEATTLEGGKQVIAFGPFASQEAIKQLGTNGGGPFNANAAHPFENPNPFTNFLSMFLIFAIPAGLTFTFGRMAGDQRQGWALFGAMAFLFFAGVTHGLLGGGGGQPHSRGDGSGARPRQHGGQGGPLRGRQLGPLRDRHHRRLLRRGQLHARQLHPAGRPRAPLQHPARRGGVRGRGSGPLRDAGHGPPVGLHRGAHGRAAPRSTWARRSRPAR